jgi:hypothetical protein
MNHFSFQSNEGGRAVTSVIRLYPCSILQWKKWFLYSFMLLVFPLCFVVDLVVCSCLGDFIFVL